MEASRFYAHAQNLSQEIIIAIEKYCAGNNIPWDRRAFETEARMDLDQVGLDALFYGADIFPDALS